MTTFIILIVVMILFFMLLVFTLLKSSSIREQLEQELSKPVDKVKDLVQWKKYRVLRKRRLSNNKGV